MDVTTLSEEQQKIFLQLYKRQELRKDKKIQKSLLSSADFLPSNALYRFFSVFQSKAKTEIKLNMIQRYKKDIENNFSERENSKPVICLAFCWLRQIPGDAK